jgi:hypothetical protein
MSLNCSHQWDYVHPQVIYEHGETWWNDINRGRLLIRPPELSGNPTSRAAWYQTGGTGEGNDNLGLAKYFFILVSDCYVPKIL